MSALPVQTLLTATHPSLSRTAPLALPLCDLALQLRAVVVSVEPPQADLRRDDPLARRLIELGFIAGEQVRIIARAAPGGDPIGVRLGGRGGEATFALRRHEAAWVRVRPLADPSDLR